MSGPPKKPPIPGLWSGNTGKPWDTGFLEGAMNEPRNDFTKEESPYVSSEEEDSPERVDESQYVSSDDEGSPVEGAAALKRRKTGFPGGLGEIDISSDSSSPTSGSSSSGSHRSPRASADQLTSSMHRTQERFKRGQFVQSVLDVPKEDEGPEPGTSGYSGAVGASGSSQVSKTRGKKVAFSPSVKSRRGQSSMTPSSSRLGRWDKISEEEWNYNRPLLQLGWNPFEKEDRKELEKIESRLLKKWETDERVRKSQKPDPLRHPIETFSRWRDQRSGVRPQPQPQPQPDEEPEASIREFRTMSTQTDVTFRPQYGALSASQSRYLSKFQPDKDTIEPSRWGRFRKTTREAKKDIKRRWQQRGRQPIEDNIQINETEEEETGIGTQTDTVMPTTHQRIPKEFRYMGEKKIEDFKERLKRTEMKLMKAKHRVVDALKMIKVMRNNREFKRHLGKLEHLKIAEDMLIPIRKRGEDVQWMIMTLQEKSFEKQQDKRNAERVISQVKGETKIINTETDKVLAYIRENVAR